MAEKQKQLIVKGNGGYPGYRAVTNVPIEEAMKRNKDGNLVNRKGIVLKKGFPTPQNDYTYSAVHYKIPTKIEKFIYTSLATLGGVATGLITYFKLIQPLISR